MSWEKDEKRNKMVRDLDQSGAIRAALSDYARAQGWQDVAVIFSERYRTWYIDGADKLPFVEWSDRNEHQRDDPTFCDFPVEGQLRLFAPKLTREVVDLTRRIANETNLFVKQMWPAIPNPQRAPHEGWHWDGTVTPRR